ncbi:MAG: hypothetical protein ACXQTW_00670 [Candidatus Methanospirareceae archaeon]
MKTIKYTINSDGTIALDFNGFRGEACIAEFEKILKALKDNYGVTTTGIKQEMKPEYYQKQMEVQEQ